MGFPCNLKPVLLLERIFLQRKIFQNILWRRAFWTTTPTWTTGANLSMKQEEEKTYFVPCLIFMIPRISFPLAKIRQISNQINTNQQLEKQEMGTTRNITLSR